jgi:hypothetical protein
MPVSASAAAWVDGSPVSKTAVRGVFRSEVSNYVATVAELRLLTTGGMRCIFVGRLQYIYDPADTTSADDGNLVVISADSLRYKYVPPAGASAQAAALGGGFLINGDLSANIRVFAGGALTAGVYGFDRWKAASGGASLTVAAGVVTLTSGGIEQIIEPPVFNEPSLANRVVTISAEDPSGTLSCVVGTVSASITAGAGRRSATLTIPVGQTGNITVRVSGTAVTFKRIKLELGSVATGWQHRDESGLLARYAQRKAFSGRSPAVGFIASDFVFDPPMRATPTAVNIVAATAAANMSIITEAAVTPYSGYYQAQSFTADGYLLGRETNFTAEL